MNETTLLTVDQEAQRRVNEFRTKVLKQYQENEYSAIPYTVPYMTREALENIRILLERKALRARRNSTWWGRVLNRFIK